MASNPQSRWVRVLIALHVGVSVALYLSAYAAPANSTKYGYHFATDALRNLDMLFTQVGVWANFMWFLSIVCYFSKHRLGQLLFAVPGIVTLIALIVHTQNAKQTWLLAPWLWAISMLLAFYAGLINYSTCPRPQTSPHEDS
jgi:uncharacterized membrane protein HdeD (DUF308 family)